MSAPEASPPERYTGGNVLIDSLPDRDRAHLAECLEVFSTDVPDCIVLHGQRFEDVIFPIDSIFSVTAELRLGNVYEVAAIGRQGVIGAEVALGGIVAPRSIMSEVDGRAARMRCAAFVDAVRASPALARAVHRHFLHRLFIAEQFVACNFAHDVSQRCARWVLMLSDELGREEFGLRTEFLGMMLGMSPAAAAESAGDLQRMEAIRYTNERIAVIDVEALLTITCECYAAQRRYAPLAA